MAVALPLRAAVEAPLTCGNCREPMQRLRLPGRYGRAVDIDLCAGCHLLWFDSVETARLSGPAMLELIGAMAASQRLPHVALRADAQCTRCRGPLKTVHNRSRWGTSLQLECLRGHGAYQSFAQFLQEKGLLRPMSRIDRAQLLVRQGHLDCINCGAGIGRDEALCRYCSSVPSLVDVARLARSLDPEGALEPHPVHGAHSRQAALQCEACGAALPPDQRLCCAQCGATLAVARLSEVHAQVAVLGPALHAHAAKPAPAVVKRRFEVLRADLPRRREWVAEMEAETRRARGAEPEGLDWDGWAALRTKPWLLLLIAVAIGIGWWLS